MEKLAKALFRFIENYPKIVDKVPQYPIASYLGITAEFLSRIRKKVDRTEEDQSGVEFSDILVKEFKVHNINVIGTPMYNWSIPSGLKSYIDQLMRINETWKFLSGNPDGNYEGLLNDKKMFILASRGDTGYGENEKNEHMNSLV